MLTGLRPHMNCSYWHGMTLLSREKRCRIGTKWFLQSIFFQMKAKYDGFVARTWYQAVLEKIFDEYMENDDGEAEISILNIPDETKTGSRKVPCLCAGLFHQIRDYLSFLVMILQCILINQSLLNYLADEEERFLMYMHSIVSSENWCLLQILIVWNSSLTTVDISTSQIEFVQMWKFQRLQS